MKKILLVLFYIITFTGVLCADNTNEKISNTKDSIKMSYSADEVIITSFKGNNNLSLQPISASLISDKIIKDRNISSIKEVTAFVPNLYIPDYGSKLTSPVYIRGIGSRINSPSVGLYVDGVPFFDRSAFDFNLNDIDRIEVLRGPQGTIYGRNTMGGIINVYTKSPLYHKGTNLGLSAGNYDNYKIEASHYGTLKKDLGYSVSGNYFHNGGYFDNEYTGKKADKMDATSGRIRLSWRISPQLTANVITSYEYSDQDGYPYAIYDEVNRKVSKVNYNERSYYKRNMSNNGLNIEYNTKTFRLASQTSFQYFDGKQGIDQDFTPSDKYFVYFTQSQKLYSQEFNIKSKNTNRYKWQFGLFGFYQDYEQTNNVHYRATDAHSINDVSNPSMGLAAYHQSTIDNLFTHGLSLVMGLRYDWEKIRMTTIPSNGVTTKDAIKGKDSYTQLTPKVSLQYTFTNDEIVYFSASRGYKAGGFNTTVEREEDRAFKPEYSWSYELGTKASCLNKLIYTDISLFYIDWSDQQISQNRPSGQGFMLKNAGKSVSKGFEITSHINPLKNLSIQLSYGYTHAKFKKYEVSDTLNYNGNYLPMVPKNTFSVAANYTLNINKTWLKEVSFNGQYVGLGDIYWNEDNKVSQPFYNTVNGQISFKREKISLDLWAKNILNEKYITYYFKLAGSPYSFAQQGKPFSFGVNLNLAF